MDKATFLLFCAGLFYVCDAYKILVVFPLPGRSHGILGDGIVRHLLNAGHEVTYVTPFPKNSTNIMLHEVDLSDDFKAMEDLIPFMNLQKILDGEVISFKAIQYNIFIAGNFISSQILKEENFQNFLKDNNQQFDAVITEWLFNDLYTTLAAVYEAPLIIFSSLEPHWLITSLIDEALNPAYNDFVITDPPPFTFLQRVEELCFTIVQTILRNTVVRYLDSSSYNKLVAPHITARGRTPPSYTELLYNASLVIGNSHVSMGDAKSLPQNYVGVGGYHIDEKIKPLPDNLQKIIESSKHGVIYFSMGSNVKSKEFPDVLKTEILKMFGSLKQTVLWKFEENLPNLPSNVHILEWAPQQSILAHPNVILFITHGGLLSIAETIYAGKPLIGIPVFGDQFITIARAVSRGFAKKVDLSYKMADDLKNAIEDVLADPKYAEKAKELSFIHHDRPVKPGDEMVHWVEHVIKTGGAPHLRSPALLVPWYQKLYLDLAALIIVTVIVVRRVYTLLQKTLIVVNTSKKTN